MANSNTSTLILSSESSSQAHMTVENMNSTQPPELHNTLDGPIAILWDIENCPVPCDVRPEDVAGNIRMALRVHPIIKGVVTLFSAYGDFNAFPRRLREGCQRTGVKLVDVPNGRKDAADKAILVDMFLFALDNRPPSTIMLISGDVDFAPSLHILGQRGYTVILVIPAGVGVSSALSNAGRFVWGWPSVVRGEGFVPPSNTVVPLPRGTTDVSRYLMGCQINENPDGRTEEAGYRGISQSFYNSIDFSAAPQSLSGYNSTAVSSPYISTVRSHSLPSCLSEVSARPVATYEQNYSTRVQPGDINGLKDQLVKMLELFGGTMLLTRVPVEYYKIFGRTLYVSDYGSGKLVNLFKKMADKISVEGNGKQRFVYLHGLRGPQFDLAKNDKTGNGNWEVNNDVIVGTGSSDEFSDDNGRRDRDKNNPVITNQSGIVDQNLEQFKYELQEILVSYNCRIFLDCFEAMYKQRYKKPLDCQRFGVNELEELFDKLRNIVGLHVEPVSKKKFLVAVYG